MSDMKPDEEFFRTLEKSSEIKKFIFYNSEGLIENKTDIDIDQFHKACHVIQNLASRVGKALGAHLEEIEFEGGGERGLIRRYEDNHFLVVVTDVENDKRREVLREELSRVEKQVGSSEKVSYRGSGVLNSFLSWVIGKR